MNFSTQLQDIRQSAEAIGQRITALQARGELDRRGSMNPNEPLRHHKRGPLLAIKPHAYRFSFSTTPTSNSTDRPVYACKIMGGLNELDAETHLRQFLRTQGLHLRSILATEKLR
ncbi:hypothetical protein NL64_06305 [Pseudomonas fluorescens]|uniref:hypothetical protein n=1 Tax=Pseudomonas fluorescens TaxID=294 RepID=UPI00054B30DE|nr:hypothetical protein [Pseudomonas fluorescens]KII34870.1 hypothetical protein NL64_06305 [Pseudomonas fluorescens]